MITLQYDVHVSRNPQQQRPAADDFS